MSARIAIGISCGALIIMGLLAVIAEKSGIASFVDLIDGVSLAETTDDATGISSKSVIDWRSQSKNTDLKPRITLRDEKGNVIKKADDNEARYYLVPDSILSVKDGQKIFAGDVIARLPKETSKTKDITGGLPRVAELFEARTPSNLSVIAEIDGKVTFGPTKRGIRKIHIEGEDGEVRKYNIPYGKHVIVHGDDQIPAGTPLCEGSVSPVDILSILGPGKVREYLVNEIQEVYRLQGVKIDDKHIEVIVRQMMQKVSVNDPGNTHFLPGDRVNKADFFETNNAILSKAVIASPGDSDYEEGMLIDKAEIRDANKELKEKGKNPIKTHKTKPATFDPLLMGITQASLNTESFISAASFQETTRVLTNAAAEGKTDYLRGLKENVAVGRLIPAGTGSTELRDIIVAGEDSSIDMNADPILEEKEKA